MLGGGDLPIEVSGLLDFALWLEKYLRCSPSPVQSTQFGH